MRRRQLRIRRWLAMGVALGTLGVAAPASAGVVAGDGVTGGGGSGTVIYPQTRLVVSEPSPAFDWSDAAIGAGVALGAALGAAGIMRVASGQRRLPGLAG